MIVAGEVRGTGEIIPALYSYGRRSWVVAGVPLPFPFKDYLL